MPGDGNDLKKWGTIFLGNQRESTVSELDAMQAAVHQEQWNQKTEDLYMEKVRAKATERAKAILGEAYTERQSILEETRALAQSMQQQAQQEIDKAGAIRAAAEEERQQAQATLQAAEDIKAAAHQEGYEAGVAQANAELAEFRHMMGTSVAGVLGEIHRQCDTIFAGWRDDLCELVRVCVEKATGVAVTLEHDQMLRTLLVESIRMLDDRQIITLRVHPDDEPAIADLVNAAKESIPDIGQWAVQADPAMQPGGIVAEGRSGTVDNRLELYTQLVEDIIRSLHLPPSNLDAQASAAVEQALLQEQARIATLAPPPQAPATPQTTQAEIGQPAPTAPAEAPAEAPVEAPIEAPMAAPESPGAGQAGAAGIGPDGIADGIDLDALQAQTAQLLAQESAPLAPEELLTPTAPPDPEALMAAQEQLAAATSPKGLDPLEGTPLPTAEPEPTREQLEEELLPLPEDMLADEAEPALAQGGFLEQPTDTAPVFDPQGGPVLDPLENT